MPEQRAVADVERLVVDQQPDELAVRGVDEALVRLGPPVGRLRVVVFLGLVAAVDVGSGRAARLALLEVPRSPMCPLERANTVSACPSASRCSSRSATVHGSTSKITRRAARPGG